jgi:purine-binding chemotaxis protein CheW
MASALRLGQIGSSGQAPGGKHGGGFWPSSEESRRLRASTAVGVPRGSAGMEALTDVATPKLALVCRIPGAVCALPLERVVETMRPLAVESLSGAPSFVRGLAIVRGAPVPVVDAAALLGAADGCPRRFVIVRAGIRRVALAVDEVVGVRALPWEQLDRLPSLLRDAAADVVARIGTLDDELLLVMESTRLIPDGAWMPRAAGDCAA